MNTIWSSKDMQYTNPESKGGPCDTISNQNDYHQTPSLRSPIKDGGHGSR